MPDWPSAARLSGERVVGVDSEGTIAIIAGVIGAPTSLWGEMLTSLDPVPTVITRTSVRGRDGSPAEPPTQIEVRVCSPDHIVEALDWLAHAVDRINQDHHADERRLEAIYHEALACVDAWYDAERDGINAQDPKLN